MNWLPSSVNVKALPISAYKFRNNMMVQPNIYRNLLQMNLIDFLTNKNIIFNIWIWNLKLNFKSPKLPIESTPYTTFFSTPYTIFFFIKKGFWWITSFLLRSVLKKYIVEAKVLRNSWSQQRLLLIIVHVYHIKYSFRFILCCTLTRHNVWEKKERL